MHLLLNRWTEQLQTLQMLWLDQKRVFAMVYHRLKSSNVFVSLKSVLILANSAYPDEMLQFVVSNLGIHCLPVYYFVEGFY